MRLKGLELQGFKSFADKIELQFGGGITGIVGPNGSGKSNIADAIRWVMGEQSAKSLRGGNMQDVIFSGTQKRKPLGFAEVSLIVDNTDKQLPLDFDEVVVTRRLFRSGESEYYINKSSVRLKDVHELFMDTGVGRDGYSMIGQGKIAEIISTKSEDRRTMFEEAAGITRFRYRKEEAERKLAHTRDNVQRVNDIITEIEGQIGPLKIQSEKAKKYLNLRDALRVLEVSVSLENIVRFRASVQEAEEQLLQLQGQLSDVDAQAADNERQTEEIFRRIAEAEQFAEQQREKQQGSMQSLADCKSDIGVLNGKIDGNNDNIKRIEAEIRELNARFDELEGASADEDGGLAALQQREREMCAQISALEEEDRRPASQAASAEQAGIEALHTDIVDALGSNAAVRSKISNCRALIQNFEQRGAAVAPGAR